MADMLHDAEVESAGRKRRRLGPVARALLSPSGVALVVIVLCAVFADRLTPYGEAEINPLRSLEPPSLDHPMETDMFGRRARARRRGRGRR